MNDFRTIINVGVSAHTFGLSDQLLTIGSCFADSIGSRLHQNKIQCTTNPFGVLYNPNSIHQALRYSIFNEVIPQHTYLHHQDIYSNYNFHSEISALHREELEQRIIQTIGSTHYLLKDASWIMITYGSAWVYERKETGEIVANCHKQSADLFKKSLLTHKKMIESFESMYHDVKKLNPTIRIILTVSPVRHIKDTLELNSVSKSVLRLACHTLTQTFSDVDYFPAYEMMMDDLRDYRYYKRDMIHPTEQAEDYIWEKFIERYADQPLKGFFEKWKEIKMALAHRPFHPSSAAHQKFLHQTLKKLEELKSTINVDEEINTIKAQLIHAH